MSQSPRFHEAPAEAQGQLILSIHKGISDHLQYTCKNPHDTTLPMSPHVDKSILGPK